MNIFTDKSDIFEKNNKLSIAEFKNAGITGFTALPNDAINDISRKAGSAAAGLWLTCCQHSKDFIISVEFLIKTLNDTANSIRKSLKQLRELGYAKLHKRIGEGGRKLGSYYTFSNVPVTDWREGSGAASATVGTDMFGCLNVQTPQIKKIPDRDLEKPNLGKVAPLKDNNKKKPNNIILPKPDCPAGRVENLDFFEHEKIDDTEQTIQAEFDKLYDFVYPRKEKRKEALKAFKRITKGKTCNQVREFSALLKDHIEKRINNSAQWAWAIVHDRTKIPLLTSFLNGCRWTDDYPTVRIENIAVLQAKNVDFIAAPETRMTRDWQPEAMGIEQLRSEGIDDEIIRAALNDFILYWLERGDFCATWSSRFVQFTRKNQARFAAPTRLTRDIPFAEILDRSWAD